MEGGPVLGGWTAECCRHQGDLFRIAGLTATAATAEAGCLRTPGENWWQGRLCTGEPVPNRTGGCAGCSLADIQACVECIAQGATEAGVYIGLGALVIVGIVLAVR